MSRFIALRIVTGHIVSTRKRERKRELCCTEGLIRSPNTVFVASDHGECSLLFPAKRSSDFKECIERDRRATLLINAVHSCRMSRLASLLPSLDFDPNAGLC